MLMATTGILDRYGVSVTHPNCQGDAGYQHDSELHKAAERGDREYLAVLLQNETCTGKKEIRIGAIPAHPSEFTFL